MHSISIVRIFFLIAIVSMNLSMYESKHLCRPCHGPLCNVRLEDLCPFGDIKNDCDEYVCAKGPGEECSKHAGGTAVCQEGLMCDELHGICVGCLSRFYPGVKDHCFHRERLYNLF